MQQATFASLEFQHKAKRTRREVFLNEMLQVVAFSRLEALIEPHYAVKSKERADGRGRPARGVSLMLKMYFLQQWFGLADEALEDTIYDSQAMSCFLGLDIGSERVPDATTLLQFRRLLEQKNLTQAILAEVNAHLTERGLLLRQGTLIDASIFQAPSSTKNQEKSRDAEMHQTKKGNQWHFGAKAHIGVDAQSGLVHTVVTTAANVADVAVASQLLHGQEQSLHADAGYTGLERREEITAVQEAGTLNATLEFHIAEKRGKIKALPEGEHKTLRKTIEHLKAKIRARVEHPFHIVKNLFKHKKLRYKGIAKNGAQMNVLFALANLVIVKRSLLGANALIAS
jgi:IS5 family transposase